MRNLKHFYREATAPARIAGWRAVAFFVAVALLIGVGWDVTADNTPDDASRYTTAVFLGALLADAFVAALMLTSRHLRYQAKLDERAALEAAAVAFVFRADGQILLHLHPETGEMSWPGYWLPPGGGVHNQTHDHRALSDLREYVNDHEWGASRLIAHTNDSNYYRRINAQHDQVPVSVYAYWFKWTEEWPFIPEDASFEEWVTLAPSDELPTPMPPYYRELIKYISALRTGADRPELKSWETMDLLPLKAAFDDAN